MSEVYTVYILCVMSCQRSSISSTAWPTDTHTHTHTHKQTKTLNDVSPHTMRRQQFCTFYIWRTKNAQVRNKTLPIIKRDIERVQAPADISRTALCCHSNETRAPIANPPNSAQLGSTPYHSPKLHPGPWSSMGMRQGTAQTHRQTHSLEWPIYILHRLRLTRNVIKCFWPSPLLKQTACPCYPSNQSGS